MNLNINNLADIISKRLEAAFSPQSLEVIDESDQHFGHAAHNAGSRHFAIVIAAESLKNLTRVAAHQKIYATLTDLMPHPLHALKIKIID